MDLEASRLQEILEHRERAGIGRRDRRAAHQIAGNGNGVDHRLPQSRSSSLMLVLARVRSSTLLTITAQAVEGPG